MTPVCKRSHLFSFVLTCWKQRISALSTEDLMYGRALSQTLPLTVQKTDREFRLYSYDWGCNKKCLCLEAQCGIKEHIEVDITTLLLIFGMPYLLISWEGEDRAHQLFVTNQCNKGRERVFNTAQDENSHLWRWQRCGFRYQAGFLVAEGGK